MEWLNYHHLLYFYVAAKEGGIAKASTQLRLAQPTISTQIRALEESLGQKLFQKSGRGLALTEMGRLVYGYADEIFTLGRELNDVARERHAGKPLKVMVGVADVLPKLIAYELLKPAFALPEPVRIVCHEDKPERLFTRLAS